MLIYFLNCAKERSNALRGIWNYLIIWHNILIKPPVPWNLQTRAFISWHQRKIYTHKCKMPWPLLRSMNAAFVSHNADLASRGPICQLPTQDPGNEVEACHARGQPLRFRSPLPNVLMRNALWSFCFNIDKVGLDDHVPKFELWEEGRSVLLKLQCTLKKSLGTNKGFKTTLACRVIQIKYGGPF